MMNVEIITIISSNYGNRLQNFALQEFLKKMGISVRTSRINHFKHPFLRIVRNLILNFYRKNDNQLFLFFDSKINWKKNSLPTVCDDEKIDYYIAGSDQIWNPLFDFNSDREFLRFTSKHKRISYAGSIGIKELPENLEKTYAKYFIEFKNISVREMAVKQIIRNISGLDVPVVLDPTLLLNAEEWKNKTKTSVLKIKEPYIVKYFLGIRNKKYENFIDEYARLNSYRIIDITKHQECGIKGIGPDEFVNLFSNCQAAFVDSFHGTVFSIIFRKTFLVFNRPSEAGFGDMNSRFDSILGMLELNDRYVSKEEDLFNINKPINYDKVHNLLKREQEKSEKYLKEALSI